MYRSIVVPKHDLQNVKVIFAVDPNMHDNDETEYFHDMASQTITDSPPFFTVGRRQSGL